MHPYLDYVLVRAMAEERVRRALQYQHLRSLAAEPERRAGWQAQESLPARAWRNLVSWLARRPAL